MVYKFFDKKFTGKGFNNKAKQNKQLAEELHKPIIKKKIKEKGLFSFKDNICGTDLADM